MKKKTNDYLLTLPIRSVNNAVKEKLAELNGDISFEHKGIKYKKNHFYFRVTKIKKGHSLGKYDEKSKQIIHINQIKEEHNIFLCVAFKDKFECFKLDKRFYKKAEKLMLTQHNSKEFKQIHTTYDNFRSMVKPIWSSK